MHSIKCFLLLEQNWLPTRSFLVTLFFCLEMKYSFKQVKKTKQKNRPKNNEYSSFSGLIFPSRVYKRNFQLVQFHQYFFMMSLIPCLFSPSDLVDQRICQLCWLSPVCSSLHTNTWSLVHVAYVLDFKFVGFCNIVCVL